MRRCGGYGERRAGGGERTGLHDHHLGVRLRIAAGVARRVARTRVARPGRVLRLLRIVRLRRILLRRVLLRRVAAALQSVCVRGSVKQRRG